MHSGTVSNINVDHVAGRIELGDGDEIFGLFGHVDVVPAGPGWQTDPLTPLFAMARFMGAEPAMTKAQVSLLTMP
ncbi:dipeptidase PepV [Lacticaseibacillus rhamnosus MTCC 5462]|nr:dipeptidase PepV [Lacticaseibacillus rhamnosus MTCC 5462]